LGYGPESLFWDQYVDATGAVTYSIELAKAQSLTKGLNSNGAAVSNITFGGSGNQESYLDTPSIVLTASKDESATVSTDYYSTTAIGFGTVYQTDGSDSSQYFSNFTDSNDAEVYFNTNFEGLGLPELMYS
jgi:hypothetical protein